MSLVATLAMKAIQWTIGDGAAKCCEWNEEKINDLEWWCKLNWGVKKENKTNQWVFVDFVDWHTEFVYFVATP